MERSLKNLECSTKLLLRITVGVSLLLGGFSNHYGATIPQSTAPPLVFRIMVQPKICRGGSLAVDAELVNHGNEPVAVDRRLIWYRSTFQYSTIGSNGQIKGEIKTSNGDFGEAAKDGSDYLLLRSGQSYKARRTFKLDEEFFKSGQTFSLQFTYGQFFKAAASGTPLFIGTVNSNRVEFKLTNCNRKQHSTRN